VILTHVHVPKTGGSTLRYVLRASFGVRHCDVRRAGREPFDAADLAAARRAHPFGLVSLSGHGLARPDPAVAPQLACFTFLREPVARFLSAYQHHVRSEGREQRGGRLKSIESFLWNRTSKNRQVQMFAGAHDLEAAKRELESYLYVGLLERFDESLAELAALSPHPLDRRYAVQNASPSSDAKRAVLADPAQRKLVEEANALDLELYAWARDVLGARQRERIAAARDAVREVSRSALHGRLRARASRTWNLVVYRRVAGTRGRHSSFASSSRS
jgi:hypothetical protein